MTVVVEREPKDGNQFEVGRIISYLYHKQSTVEERFEFLTKEFSEEFFFYKGGSHIAIHELDFQGKPEDERLIFVEL